MADLYETMSTLRAVRRLRPDPIPDDVLERLLQAACWAPTGGNAQPWRVIVVRDGDLKAGLADIYKRQWDPYAVANRERLSVLPPDKLAPWERIFDAGDYLAEHFAASPALLVFCHNPAMMAFTDQDQDRVSVVGGASVYPAVQNLMLACVAEGIGCAITTLHCQDEPAVKALLGIPDDWGTSAIIPIGYPVLGGHGPIKRLPPAKMAFADRFDQPWG